MCRRRLSATRWILLNCSRAYRNQHVSKKQFAALHQFVDTKVSKLAVMGPL
jgi:hypothetical protein